MVVQKALEIIAADAARGDLVFPTHAEMALRVQRMLDDPDCSIDKLSKLIAAEPMLSARVVAIANSVAYNRGGRNTTDVKGAISRLGFKTVRVLATAVVVRQMEAMSKTPEHRALAAKLWEHTAHVAALARVIAQRVVHVDPNAAFFAGIVHEVGGFYLLSRAANFPGLLEGDLGEWDGEGEARIGGAVLRVLGVPQDILDAAETLWGGYLNFPPQTLGDALLLAEQLSPVESPLSRIAGTGHEGAPVDIDVAIDDETLKSILAESAEEVASLVAALKS
jgi:HD-like signal output (HDOD) protein